MHTLYWVSLTGVLDSDKNPSTGDGVVAQW